MSQEDLVPQFRKGLTEFRGELDRRCFTRVGRPGKRHRIPGQRIRGDGFGGCQPILGDGRPAGEASAGVELTRAALGAEQRQLLCQWRTARPRGNGATRTRAS